MSREAFLKQQFQQIDFCQPSALQPIAKHLKMASSPFQFFRGSAHLFYADMVSGINTLPAELQKSELKTRVMGDCHLANFGLFTEEGSGSDRVIFAPNDFDDACLGYAVWDLARFITSIYLAADYGQGVLSGDYVSEYQLNGERVALTHGQIVQACNAFLNAYQTCLANVIDNHTYRDTVIDAVSKGHVLRKPFKKARKRAAGGELFAQKSQLAKSVVLVEGKLMFTERAEKFKRLSAEQYIEVVKAFSPYVDDAVLDIVTRINSGTGSNNIKRYYLLVGPRRSISPSDLHLCHIVEVKQQRQAAPLYSFDDLSEKNSLNPAHLTLSCQRLMQRKPDLILDEVIWQDKHWLVRSRHHAKVSVDLEALVISASNESDALNQYASACGYTLALAHSRADRRSTEFEAAFLALLPKYHEVLIESAKRYFNQVKQDFNWLVDALSVGSTDK